MYTTVAKLKIGEKGIIQELQIDKLPLKLIEMGCLPGNSVQLIHKAPSQCPLYLDLNGTQLAIREQLASQITVKIAG